MKILIITAIIVLILAAIALSIIIADKLNISFAPESKAKEDPFMKAARIGEQRRLEREKELEEQRNWKPSRNKLFVSKTDYKKGDSK